MSQRPEDEELKVNIFTLIIFGILFMTTLSFGLSHPAFAHTIRIVLCGTIVIGTILIIIIVKWEFK